MEPFGAKITRDDPDKYAPSFYPEFVRLGNTYGWDAVESPDGTLPIGCTTVGQMPPDEAPEPGSEDDLRLVNLVAIFKRSDDGTIDFAMRRTLPSLIESGAISEFRGRLLMEGGVIGYWHNYKLIRRGRKATLAANIDSLYNVVTEETLRSDPDVIAAAFPTFVARLANAKTQAPGLPMAGHIPDDSGNRFWTLLVDFDTPTIDKPFHLSPDIDWTSSRRSLIALFTHPVMGKATRDIDATAYALLDDARKYFMNPLRKRWIAYKCGVRRDWRRLRRDPIGLTILTIGPLLGLVDAAEDTLGLTVEDSVPFNIATSTVDLLTMYRLSQRLGREIGKLS